LTGRIIDEEFTIIIIIVVTTSHCHNQSQRSSNHRSQAD
jgi:hypothetical protein